MIEAAASQGGFTCTSGAIVTVTQTLVEREEGEPEARGKGLPGYTFLRAPGELWRSRFDEKNNLVVINNGHRDYVFASQRHGRKLKYISRLFIKELVLANFPGFDRRELLERRTLVVRGGGEAVASAQGVLDDVELALREVADLPSCVKRGDVERLRQEVERRQLLMRIRLMTRELEG